MSTGSPLSTTESLLIELLRGGSKQAFDQIYSMYVHRLMGFCMQMTKSREDAEEIVQDTFVQLWTHREQIKRSDSLKAFLFTIAKRRIINAYRSLASSVIYEDYVDYLDVLDTEDASADLSFSEFLELLERIIGELPATQAKVIKLSKLEDRSNKEISQMLSLSEQTVKNQLSLGLRTLRTRLGTFAGAVVLFFIKLWDFLG